MSRTNNTHVGTRKSYREWWKADTRDGAESRLGRIHILTPSELKVTRLTPPAEGAATKKRRGVPGLEIETRGVALFIVGRREYLLGWDHASVARVGRRRGDEPEGGREQSHGRDPGPARAVHWSRCGARQ
jgi:hypothetical protein